MKKKSLLGLVACTLFVIQAQADDVMLLHTYSNETQSIVVDNIANIRHSQGQVIISLNTGDEVTLSIQEVKAITFQSLSSDISQLSVSQAKTTFRIYNMKGVLVQEGVTDASGHVTLPDNLHGIFVIQVGQNAQIVRTNK
ncbi:MAG: hypothetical protein J6Y99_08815 [Bacteroidales bacterium]|nr:hypothetical protein [Bacteroidales bacterium]